MATGSDEIVFGTVNDLIKAMLECVALVEKAQDVCTTYLDDDRPGAQAAIEGMRDIMIVIDGPEARASISVAQRVIEVYNEGKD